MADDYYVWVIEVKLIESSVSYWKPLYETAAQTSLGATNNFEEMVGADVAESMADNSCRRVTRYEEGTIPPPPP